MRYISMLVLPVVFVLGAHAVGLASAQESTAISITSTIAEVKGAKTESERLTALERLKGQKPNNAADVDALTDALREKAISVQTLTKMLLNADNARLIPVFIQALNDSDADVQNAAALVLGKMKAKEAVPVLIEKFKAMPEFSSAMDGKVIEASAKLGANIAAALGLIGEPSAVPALMKRREFYFLEHGESPLALIGAPALPALLAVARDKKDPRKNDICIIISSIKDTAAVPLLMDVLRDSHEDPRIRTSALAALGKMGASGIEPYAHEMLTTSNKDARLGALYWIVKYDKATYAAKLVEFLNDEDWEVRAVSAKFAGDLGVREAAPRLLEILKDKDAFVRKNALRSLEKLGNVKANYAVLDDRHARATLVWEGKKYETVIDDMSLVSDIQKGLR